MPKPSSKQNFEAKQEAWNAISWPDNVIELHVHLGGSVPLDRLWELAVIRGIRGMGAGYAEFVQMLKREEGSVYDLDSYLEIYDRVELIQSGPQAVRECVIIALHRAFLQGGLTHLAATPTPPQTFQIRGIELRFNPLKRTGAVFLKGSHAGLYDVDRIIRAAATAAADVELGFKSGFRSGLLFCFGRDMTFEANMVLARKVRLWAEQEDRILGLDLAGPESVNPLSDSVELKKMREVYDEAGPNLKRTIHVGETPHVDLKTFLSTIEAIEPERVAHPITACRAYWEKGDSSGLDILREREIVCELCVQSNILTGAVSNLEEYRRILDTFDEFGIAYTFSTDGPSLQMTSLASELQALFFAGGVNEEQIIRSFEAAQKATFLKPSS